MMKLKILFLITTLVSTYAHAVLPSHQGSKEEIVQALKKNLGLGKPEGFKKGSPGGPQELRTKVAVSRPVEEYAKFKYLLLSAYTEGVYEAEELRKTFAQNLPADMKLIVLADKYNAQEILSKFQQWIPDDRLIIAEDDSTAGGFWARDAFPVPVYLDAQKNVGLIAAEYFRRFESHKILADVVKAQYLEKMNFTFVGGNLIADEKGTCFIVDSIRLFGLSEDTFKKVYGCKIVHKMAHKEGIGDVDEVLKPLPGNKVLTNVEDYVQDLEKWGYEVVRIPAMPRTYRTYVNSVILNGTVFMPSYGVPEDDEAAKVYENLGYKVVKVSSVILSDLYQGSLHCQTMAYPEMGLQTLLDAMKLRRIY